MQGKIAIEEHWEYPEVDTTGTVGLSSIRLLHRPESPACRLSNGAWTRWTPWGSTSRYCR
jgi:hypothetical protein